MTEMCNIYVYSPCYTIWQVISPVFRKLVFRLPLRRRRDLRPPWGALHTHQSLLFLSSFSSSLNWSNALTYCGIAPAKAKQTCTGQLPCRRKRTLRIITSRAFRRGKRKEGTTHPQLDLGHIVFLRYVDPQRKAQDESGSEIRHEAVDEVEQCIACVREGHRVGGKESRFGGGQAPGKGGKKSFEGEEKNGFSSLYSRG